MRLQRVKTNKSINKKIKYYGIISFGNILAHEYDFVMDEMVWSIIIKHLPKLKLEIEKMIKVGEKKDRASLKNK